MTEDVTTEVNGDVTTVTTTKTTTLSGKTGAVHLENGSVKITGDATFTGNTAATNGALYAKGGVDVDGNLTFSSNEANGATTVEVTVVTTTTTYDEEGNVTGESVETSTTTTTTYDQGNNGAGSVGGDLNVGGALNVTSNKATNNVGGLNVDGAVKVAGDAILTGNEAGGNVGALTANSVEVGGSATIKDNKAGGDFGGANVQNAFKVTGALTVDANTAGGNVGALTAGSVTVGGDLSATANKAKGGDVGAIYVDGALTVTGSATFDGNTATGDYGAAYVGKSATIDGSLTATNNEAGGNVGALAVQDALTVKGDATFSGNKAGGSIGALSVSSVTVDGNLTATNNEAQDGNYGVAYVADALTVKGDVTLSDNKASGDYGVAYVGTNATIGGNLTVTDNAAGGVVGALAAQSLLVGSADSEEPVAVTVTGNKAGGNYGAIYLGDSAIVYGNATFANNQAALEAVVTSTSAVAIGENGETIETTVTTTTVTGLAGALYTVGGFQITGDAKFNDNTAAQAGAAYVGGDLQVGGELEMTGNIANGKVTTKTVVKTSTYDEEGALVSETTTESESVAYDDANYGAAYVGANIVVDGNVTLANNTANGAYGAVSAQGNATVGGDATITGNEAKAGRVGALDVAGNLSVNGLTTVANNTAADNIGAVNVGGDATFSGYVAPQYDEEGNEIESNAVALTVSGNVSKANVGAMRVEGALTVDGDATIENNSAAIAYGAVLARSTVNINGDATLTGNKAQGGSYGALYVFDAATIVGNATVTNNEASEDVGAIYVLREFTVNGDAKIADNKAGQNFGAIYSNLQFNIDGNAEITGNVAEQGNVGAVRSNYGLTIGGDATIANNQAGLSNGAIKTDTAIVIGGAANITGNKAGENVGAIETLASLSIGGDATITDNSAQGDFGAIKASVLNVGSSENGANATITGNSAKGNYGAIYVSGSGSALNIFGNATITGNAAGGNTTVEEYAVQTTDENGAQVDVVTKTTTTYGKAGAVYAPNGTATIMGNADISGNTAAQGGALVLSGSLYVNGDLTMDGNSANGQAVVETVTTVTTFDEEGNVAEQNVTTESQTVYADAAYGAAYLGGKLSVAGNLSLQNNSAKGEYGAVYAGEDVAVDGNATIVGNSASQVGAIYAKGAVSVSGLAKVVGNKATNGNVGAIYADAITLANALVAENTATENVGAFYVNDLTLVNATVANNSATNAGALYVLRSAAIDNSILAGNSAEQGVDIFADANAAITLRNSLIQNIESTGDLAFSEAWLQADYRSLVGVDPQLNEDYTLKATSPAINAGKNELGNGAEVDLAGNVRVIGLNVGGVVYSIDMGAFEYQTVIAPDLAMDADSVNFWYSYLNNVQNSFYYYGEDVILDFSFQNLGDATVIDKFDVAFTVVGTTSDGSDYSVTKIARYQNGSVYFDWLSESEWVYSNGEVTYARQNLGVLPTGSYALTIVLDVNGEIVEWGEEDGSEATPNNVYSGAFEIHETPTLVVNTDADGEYNPLDDKITLREAAEFYVGPSTYGYKVLIDDATFVRDDLSLVKVVDGKATVSYNVVNIAGSEIRVSDGDSAQYGATYVTYDKAKGEFHFPNGDVEVYARSNYSYSLTLTMSDGSEVVAKPISKIEYLESTGQPYSDKDLGVYVDVLVLQDGSQILLSDLQDDSILYQTTHVTYRASVATDASGVAHRLANGDAVTVNGKDGVYSNGAVRFNDGGYQLLNRGDAIANADGDLTYVGAALCFEDGDGSCLPFEDGTTVTAPNGLEIGLAVKQEAVSGSITTADGLVVTFNEDGSTVLTHELGNTITFADNLLASATKIKLDGSEITLAKDQVIDATTPNGSVKITVDAGSQSRVFTVNSGVTATINSMTLVNGKADVGGAIANRGELTLNNVSVRASEAFSTGEVGDDHVLRDGLGGAIYNSGALTINGGTFSSNKSTFFGGAIYSIGGVTINDATFTGNRSNYNGGAIYALNSSVAIQNSILQRNVAANNGGAIAISVSRGSAALTVANSLITDNTATATNGGAIYAYAISGANVNVDLTNVTVAGNSAQIGGGLYGDNATFTVKNSIIAKNKAQSSNDVALDASATMSLDASLLGDGQDVVEPSAITVVSTALIGTKDAPIDPLFDASYKLTKNSPAINAGKNELALDLDGNPIAKDVNGANRYVGVQVDDVIYSVDMGATEFQGDGEVAVDLSFPTDKDALTGWYGTVAGEDLGEFFEGWDVSFAYVFGNYLGNATLTKSFNYSIVVAKLDENDQVVEGSEKTYTRSYGDDVYGFMSQQYWLGPNGEVEGFWNLGAFEAGRYSLTFTLDVDGAIYELNEDNNVYGTTFTVSERPSLIVTTEQDVVDRYDGKVSLREAIDYVAASGATTVAIKTALDDGDTFQLMTNESAGIQEGAVATYSDGKLTYVNADGETVELAANVEYDLANGETLLWNGDATAVLSQSFGNTITFVENVYGKTIALADGELMISRNMEINGDGANVTVDANGQSRAFFVAHGDQIVLRGLTLANGQADVGGAIYNAANLYLTNVTINDAAANERGGAIYNADSSLLDASNLTITGAEAQEGAAIYNAGQVTLNTVNVSGSSANTGAGLYSTGLATITDALFSGNTATERAGAIMNDGGVLNIVSAAFDSNEAQYGGAIVNYQAATSLANVSFSGNKATKDAGAIDNYGSLTITDGEFLGNSAQGFGGAIYNSMSSAKDKYTVELNGTATFSRNSADKGGALYNSTGSEVKGEATVLFTRNSATDGGAVYNAGALTSNAWTFQGNNATGNGGAIYNVGAVDANATLFQSNTAKNGGALYNAGSFYATGSNFDGNAASVSGGAIYNAASSTVSVANTVVWRNAAGTNGGAILNAGNFVARNATVAANSASSGGALYNTGTTQAYNTILAGNYAASGVDMYSTSTVNMYNSIVSSTTGVGRTPNMANSKVGDPGFATAPVFNAGSLANASSVDVSLTVDSIAVNAGNDAYALDAYGLNALQYDVAGNVRICTSLDSVDIGAFEFPFEEPSVIVTTDEDVYDLTDGKISLREAIDYALRLGETEVKIDPSITAITLASTLEINDTIKIVAEDGVTLKGGDFVGAVVAVGTTTQGEKAKVELENITISGGNNVNSLLNDDPNYSGGGLVNYAELTLTNVTIEDNKASYGGGVYNAGKLSIYNSTLQNNTALYYGGLYNRGELYVEGTLIAGNTGTIYGGGVGSYTGATIVNSEIIGNVATTGAGVFIQINASDLIASDADWDVNLVNTTIVGNVASENGGGVWVNHILNVDNSIVYGNTAKTAADLYVTSIFANSATQLRYSDVGVSNVNVAGQGVKSVDPNFVNFTQPTSASAIAWQDWDLNLAIDSALINAGSNSLAVGQAGALAVDMAGNARIVNSKVDMGALEEQGNLPPTAVTFTPATSTVLSTDPVGTVVGVFNTEDANGDDSFTYEIVDGDGNFAIDGDKLVLAKQLPAGDYEVSIKSTDSGNASIETTVTISVADPDAESYNTPVITAIGKATDGSIVVTWETDDPAKEYVVQYRVKGATNWESTSALTGDFGSLVNANFKTGDVIEARIKALTSSTKNESGWSDIVSYEIVAPQPFFNVDYNSFVGANYLAANFTIDASDAHAYWAIDWNDGSAMTEITALATNQTLSHLYRASGVYAPILYIDNMEGVALDRIIVTIADGSHATLDVAVKTANVFSAIEPIAVSATNEFDAYVVKAEQKVETVVVAPRATSAQRLAKIQARFDAFAQLANSGDKTDASNELTDEIFGEFIDDGFED
ncbi:MAG: choice-of-anchor Q domain-containing protein [Planctomycetia bacterium]|nr:choice-of-anchor Q domain-containing protein [Planctomycetia bacterium]